jgi:hypothetical protein
MKKLIYAAAVCLALGAMRGQAELTGEASPIEWPRQYVAEIVATMMGTRSSSKLFVDGEKIRTETSVAGTETISIMRPDKKVVYSVMPAQRMYMETPYGDTPVADPIKAKGHWEKVGNEIINEQECVKYRLTSEHNGSKSVMFFWVNKDKLPVRMSTEDGKAITDYVSIKKETPNSSLFDPPADYQKMEMPAMPKQ